MTKTISLSLLIAWLLVATPATAQPGLSLAGSPAVSGTGELVPVYELPSMDPGELRAADELRVKRGRVPHYAAAHQVRITPWEHGTWDQASEGRLRWRLRLSSPEALSLNLAFGRYQMPKGGRLKISSQAGHRIGPFTARDNEEHGQLWTPPIPADELLLELDIPEERFDDLQLELSKIHHGYAGFGEPPPRSGDCHVDVSCEEAEPWSDQVRAVGLVSVAGVRFCTGFLVNNTALDGRPFFLTAHHCAITPANAPSVVVMWNHQQPGCDSADETGRTAIGSGAQFQTGATFRAAYRAADMVLVELDDRPEPAFGVYYAGWDRRAIDPEGVVTIHHPNTDAKQISFSSDRALTTRHLQARTDPRGNHLRVGRWDLGTTEGGSSGAPLFNRDRRVVGQLQGGYAACGNRRADWFGRLSASWTGAGRLGTRLSDWLDPNESGALTLDGLDGSKLRP